MKKLIIIIPAYNEEKNLETVIKKLPTQIFGIDVIKVLIIDDGSIDQTSQIGIKHNATVIKHGKNRGVGATMQTGIDYAITNNADYVVNIDADNQFDPMDIEKLLKPIILDETDMVTGSRFIDEKFAPINMPKIKIFGNKIVSLIISKMTGDKIHDTSCGFRAYNQKALCSLNLFGNYTYTQESLIDLKFKNIRITEIPVSVMYFKDRKSRVANNLFKYAFNAMAIILKTLRDYRPIKFFNMIGFSLFLFGLFLDILVLIHYINAGAFTPFKSVIFIGGFLNITGFFTILVGMIADMLCRIRINQEKNLYYEKIKIVRGQKQF